MLFKNSLLSVFFLLFLSACSDDATVTINSKNLPKEKIECLRLLVFPPNKSLEEQLQGLYSFTQECEFVLQVSTKSGITCNSNHNYQSKATGVFPKSYINMQLNHGTTILYGYYKDIPESVTQKDIREAFTRMAEDLSL